jgi:SAM-dependent methyltransferase
MIEPELAQAEFLRLWHARYAGATSATFWYGCVEGDGRSSYQLLVDDIAVLSNVKTIVDLACGDGYLTAMSAERFPSAEIVGVDMSPEELALARKRGFVENVRFVEARADALPLGNASVDAVVCHMALMLFDDAQSVVDELARVIRPGGIFAAVLGPGGKSSGLMPRFVALLREAEGAENLSRLNVGDPATYAEDSLRALFASAAWSEVRADNIRLRFEGPDDQLRATLLAMYNVARLSEHGRAELERRLIGEMRELRGSADSFECGLGLRHLVGRRCDH